MANGWTVERRARQAALIMTWQPWKGSTGPKSKSGKAMSSRNADRGLEWPALRKLRALMKTQRNLSVQASDKVYEGFGG